MPHRCSSRGLATPAARQRSPLCSADSRAHVPVQNMLQKNVNDPTEQTLLHIPQCHLLVLHPLLLCATIVQRGCYSAAAYLVACRLLPSPLRHDLTYQLTLDGIFISLCFEISKFGCVQIEMCTKGQILLLFPLPHPYICTYTLTAREETSKSPCSH